jgi:AcrR family transcriptional regulator
MSIDRDQILRCACDLYLSDGIRGFSMRKLAKCVGCTAPALYRYYENKEEVFRDVVGEAYRQFTQYLYRALSGSTPVERFVMAGRSYFDFATEQPALYEIIYFPGGILRDGDVHATVAEEVCAIGQFWSDRVREMMDAGYLKKGDPYKVSTTLWAHAHGLISIHHRGLLGVLSKEGFREAMVGSYLRMMEGLATDAFFAAAQPLQDEFSPRTSGGPAVESRPEASPA